MLDKIITIDRESFQVLETLTDAINYSHDRDIIGDDPWLEDKVKNFAIPHVASVLGFYAETHSGYGELDVWAYGESDAWFGFWYVEAGCDTTGWDCQSGGSIRTCKDLDQLIRFGMSKEGRKNLGVSLPEETS